MASLAIPPGIPAWAQEKSKIHVSSNQYTWTTFANREKRNWTDNLEASLAEVAESGVNGFEPNATSIDYLEKLIPLLRKHHLQMRSIYVNSKLYDVQEARESIQQVLGIAEAAATLGTTIVVTNPSPIRWGGPEDKTDEQLKIQAVNLDLLGQELGKRKMILAYHNHDAELRNAAREFHHMLLRTNPKNVAFCLDAHWIYRGSGNSQNALFDVVKLHGPRIVELHLRQSQQGVWTESFGPGDIDYPRLVKEIDRLSLRPHLVLEQAVESKSSKKLTALEAGKEGLKFVRDHFSILASEK